MMLRRIFPYWRCAWRPTAWGVLLLVVAAGFELLQPWPIKWLIDYVLGTHIPPRWLADSYPLLASSQKISGVLAVCIAIVVLALGQRAATIGSQWLLIRAGARLVQRLRCHVCDHLHRLSLAYHDRTKVGESIYRIAYDTQAAQSILNGALVPMTSGALMLCGILIVMFRLDPLLTLVSLAATPVFWLLIKLFGRGIEKRSGEYHDRESSLVSLVQESLTSIRAVQAFTREPDAAQQFQQHTDQSLLANSKLVLAQLGFSACVGMAMALGTAAVVWFGALRVLEGRLSVGDVLVFLAYLGMLYQPMNAFSQGFSVVQAGRTQLQRVFDILDTVPDVAECAGATQPHSVQGRIELQDVSFQYTPERPALHHINLTIEPGQVVALVGRTGAGKSTLASLLLRFYDPQQGRVLFDDRDVRGLRLDWLRQQVSLVLQEPVLFSTSIAENIGFGRIGATHEQIEAAARLAQIDEFIRTLPEGYETRLSERGLNLSGGQRQRIAIARAFVKDAPILVLDEPTSALDLHTEESLLEAIGALLRGRTTIIIAHRLSVARLADRIVVLDQGRIAEQGTHSELLQADSLYARLHASQWRGTEPVAVWPESLEDDPAPTL